MLKRLKGFRTVGFNLIMGVAAFLTVQGLDVTADAQRLVDALTSLEGVLLELWTVGNLILRKVTNTAIFKRE